MKTIEERISALEDSLSKPTLSGITLSRVMIVNSPLEWTLGYGQINQTLVWFTASTINEVLKKAEDIYLK